jgi:hypothetical protein
MYTTELSWYADNYYSMSKGKLWRYKGVMASVLGVLLTNNEYQDNPLLYMTIKGIGCFVWAA